MQQKFYLSVFQYLCLLFFALNSTMPSKALGQKTVLSGKITDKSTGEALIGATVYAPDFRSGAQTGLDGSFILDNLPQKKIHLKISFIGYKTLLQMVDLAASQNQDFTLEASHIDISEVVVTGTTSEINKAPAPVVTISRKEMNQNLSTNIIDAIAKLPGINAVTTGPNVSKPFIRGLGFNRVLTLFDGVRQEGQQWGDEHGIEVDENAVERVEVIKGPASLTYGSDALAGVVNLLPQTPADPFLNKGQLQFAPSNRHTLPMLSFLFDSLARL